MKFTGTFEEYKAELDERTFNLFSDLVDTPFYMIRKRLILHARIKQLKSDIELAELYIKSNQS